MERIVQAMTKACEILVTTWDEGQVVAGRITLENGKLRATPQKGFEKIIETVRSTPTFIGDEELHPKKNPLKWLNSLPRQYSGGVLRAKLIEGEGK